MDDEANKYFSTDGNENKENRFHRLQVLRAVMRNGGNLDGWEKILTEDHKEYRDLGTSTK